MTEVARFIAEQPNAKITLDGTFDAEMPWERFAVPAGCGKLVGLLSDWADVIVEPDPYQPPDCSVFVIVVDKQGAQVVFPCDLKLVLERPGWLAERLSEDARTKIVRGRIALLQGR